MRTKFFCMTLALICFGCGLMRDQPAELAKKSQEQKLQSALQQAMRAILNVELYSNLHSITNGAYRWTVDIEENGDYTFVFDCTTDVPDLQILASVTSNGVFVSGGWFPKRKGVTEH